MKHKKRRLWGIVLALSIVASLMAISAAAAGGEPAQAGIYNIQCSQGVTLTPQTADMTPIVGESVLIGGKQETLYPGAVRFGMTAQGTPSAMYFLQVNEGDRNEPVTNNIIEGMLMGLPYVNQYTAGTDGQINCFDKSLGTPYPNSLHSGTYTVFLNNTKIATFDYYTAGVSVTGTVTSYDPKHETTIELIPSGETDTAAYTATIAALPEGSGQQTQEFTFDAVSAGTYDLVVTKAAHLKYTIQNVVVGSEPLDLGTKNAITMVVGDVNKDDKVNITDLNIVWNAANYGKNSADAGNELTDVDGNGKINISDLNIVWNAANYGKGISDCTVQFAQ